MVLRSSSYDPHRCTAANTCTDGGCAYSAASLSSVNGLLQEPRGARAALRQVLMASTETAKAMAAETLKDVRRLMHTAY